MRDAKDESVITLLQLYRDQKREKCWLVSSIRQPTTARTIPEVVPHIQRVRAAGSSAGDVVVVMLWGCGGGGRRGYGA